MATLYTQQDKNISSKKKFFSSKTNGILLLVLIVLVIVAIKIIIVEGRLSFDRIFQKTEQNQISYVAYTITNGPTFSYRSDLTVKDLKGEHTYFTFHKDPNSLEYGASLSYTDDYSEWGFSKAGTSESDFAQIYKHTGTVQYGQNIFDTWDVVVGDGYQSVLVLRNSDGQAVSIEFGIDNDQTYIDLSSINFNNTSVTQSASYSTYTFIDDVSFKYRSDKIIEILSFGDHSVTFTAKDASAVHVWVEEKYSDTLLSKAEISGTAASTKGSAEYLNEETFGSNTFLAFDSCGLDTCENVYVLRGPDDTAFLVSWDKTLIDLDSVKFR